MSTTNGSKKFARAGIVAGLYVALSLITFPVASGAIQFRIAEGLTVLPLIFPETAIGLFVGCMLSNLITSAAPWDILLGSLITLVAGLCTLLIGRLVKKTALKLLLGGLFPVLLNAFLLPVVWILCYGGLEYLYILQVLFLLISQSVSVYAVGTPLYLSVKRLKDKGYKGFID
jgi:uncharacterized membrane protein